MTISTKTTIKAFFETNDRPSQAQFADFIDSCLFLAETSSQTIQGNIVFAGGIQVSAGFASILVNPVINPQANLPTPQAGVVAQIVGSAGGNGGLEIDSFGGAPQISGVRANGTAVTKTKVSANNNLLTLRGLGHDGSAYSTAPDAQITFAAHSDWSPTNHGTFMSFSLTASGSTSSSEAARFSPDGSLQVNTSAQTGAGTVNAQTAYYVNGTKVLGVRDTGWVAMTGTPDESTVYNTGTVSTSQLAGRVMALQQALTTHGIIGT